MNRDQADRVIMAATKIADAYANDLVAIATAAKRKHGVKEFGRAESAVEDIQDQSFTLGLLAGMRADKDPLLQQFLEGGVIAEQTVQELYW